MSLGLDAAQLHGDEPPEFTASVARGVATVIKAVSATSPTVRMLDEHAADIVMLDALKPGGRDRSIAPSRRDTRTTPTE